nr:MAG TPA: hypothetical protein [Caudoviricetes sp.]
MRFFIYLSGLFNSFFGDWTVPAVFCLTVFLFLTEADSAAEEPVEVRLGFFTLFTFPINFEKILSVANSIFHLISSCI